MRVVVHRPLRGSGRSGGLFPATRRLAGVGGGGGAQSPLNKTGILCTPLRAGLAQVGGCGRSARRGGAPLGLVRSARHRLLRLRGCSAGRGHSLTIFPVTCVTYRQKGVICTNKEALAEGIRLFSVEEQDAILEAMRGSVPFPVFLGNLVLARRRAHLRASSDAETDVSRRLTCGARLPRETVERYRECAREHGLSLYAFASGALEREYRRLTE